MALRTPSNALHNRVRTYREILHDDCDPGTRLARRAIEKLITKYGITDFEIQKRIDIFQAFEHFGTGRLWKERFTIDREHANRLARRLRYDAEELRKAIAPQFKFLIGYGSPISADLICDLVGRAAMLLEGSLKETSDKSADWTLEPKRELTQFIWRTTGKRRPLDRQVSDLIAAILNCDYTYEDQRKFRQRNCHFQGTDSLFSAPPGPDNSNAKND